MKYNISYKIEKGDRHIDMTVCLAIERNFSSLYIEYVNIYIIMLYLNISATVV